MCLFEITVMLVLADDVSLYSKNLVVTKKSTEILLEDTEYFG
jgi:hypothetical protein